MNETYCNNCGKFGHMYHQCKLPITSAGIVAFRRLNSVPQYLMIRRKDTLGNVDFLRGKYSIYNKFYIINMLNQMTYDEKVRLKEGNFDILWQNIWGNNALFKTAQYNSEENASREKYTNLINGVITKSDSYTLSDLIDESNNTSSSIWTEPEWGFPKGRRNPKESDFDCAIREFCEETGYSPKHLTNVQNILPYEETFTGSNYKSYKHKYFLMYMEHSDTLNVDNYERAEVSKMEWKTYEECMDSIRPYNLEKKRLITNIHNAILKLKLVYS